MLPRKSAGRVDPRGKLNYISGFLFSLCSAGGTEKVEGRRSESIKDMQGGCCARLFNCLLNPPTFCAPYKLTNAVPPRVFPKHGQTSRLRRLSPGLLAPCAAADGPSNSAGCTGRPGRTSQTTSPLAQCVLFLSLSELLGLLLVFLAQNYV